jgi:hypothetical protein
MHGASGHHAAERTSCVILVGKELQSLGGQLRTPWLLHAWPLHSVLRGRHLRLAVHTRPCSQRSPLNPSRLIRSAASSFPVKCTNENGKTYSAPPSRSLSPKTTSKLTHPALSQPLAAPHRMSPMSPVLFGGESVANSSLRAVIQNKFYATRIQNAKLPPTLVQ